MRGTTCTTLQYNVGLPTAFATIETNQNVAVAVKSKASRVEFLPLRTKLLFADDGTAGDCLSPSRASM
jgi:hypothetical protein